jgi:Cys-tRNA(Pro)/Cys-tRNA(Cys) deacylase
MMYEEKLKAYLREQDVAGEHLHFDQSCHSVAEAAQAANVPADAFVKSIGFIDENNRLIVGIVKGEDRVSRTNVAKVLGISIPRIATAEEMLERTGYICGGTPPFGYDAVFLMDERAFEKEVVYCGGGSEQALVKISPQEILRMNRASVVRIRK